MNENISSNLQSYTPSHNNIHSLAKNMVDVSRTEFHQMKSASDHIQPMSSHDTCSHHQQQTRPASEMSSLFTDGFVFLCCRPTVRLGCWMFLESSSRHWTRGNTLTAAGRPELPRQTCLSVMRYTCQTGRPETDTGREVG